MFEAQLCQNARIGGVGLISLPHTEPLFLFLFSLRKGFRGAGF